MLLQWRSSASSLPLQTSSFHKSKSRKTRHPLHLINFCGSRISTTAPTAVLLQEVNQLAHNKVLVAAGVSAAIGQLSKPFTSVFIHGKDFDYKAAFQPGGFPSTHSSAVVAAAVSLGLERLKTPLFSNDVKDMKREFREPINRLFEGHIELTEKYIVDIDKNRKPNEFQEGDSVRAHVWKSRFSALTYNRLQWRGLSDSIFGLTVVYACLVMYDSQGVRREVGNHAKVVNKLLLQEKMRGFGDQDYELDSHLENVPCSSKANVESLSPLFLENSKNYSTVKKHDKEIKTSSTLGLAAEGEKGLKRCMDDWSPLTERVGHSEVEVIAGALLGFLVSMTFNVFV